MSHAISIPDTFQAVESLRKDAGLSEAAAKAIVQTIQKAEVKDAPATKLDLAETETRLFSRILIWVVTLTIGQFVATVGTLTALHGLLG